MANKEVLVKGISVKYRVVNQEDYIWLTDIAKFYNAEDPSGVIRNWMSNKDSFLFYSLWDEIHNQNFNSVELHRIKKEEVGLNRFTMTPRRWKDKFNAVGIIPGSGKYSEGTFAHSDIAFEFASWLNPEFKLYLITEFQRLKKTEQKELSWSAKRELARLNYHIHTEAIKDNLIVPNLTKEQINFIYANEADLLNVALFGKTKGQWKIEHPDLKGSIRDYASIDQLLVLANMESYNAILIEQGLSQKERLIQLNQMAKSQLTVLKNHQPIILIDNKK
ncbi:MAG: KilA-N domain-containing protein [Anaeroplasmataceae bacterium]|nr:KilA-N domain-containing protein [Anaeroplasmataceae bacterium]